MVIEGKGRRLRSGIPGHLNNHCIHLVLVTRLYVNCANAQPILTHVGFVDLQRRRPFDRSLGKFGGEGPILLGVEELLAMGCLRRGYASPPEIECV